MKLNKGNIMIETLLALMVVMIIIQTINSLKQLDVVKRDIVVKYEQGL